MLNRILVPLDESDYSDAAILMACHVAKSHDAEITGLVILNTPEIVEEEKLPFNLQLLDMERKGYFKMKNESQRRIKNLLEKFTDVCEKQGVKYRGSELQGMPATCILEESIYYDLMVIGMKTYFHIDPTEEGDSLEKILDHTTIPILAVPAQWCAKEFQRVLLTFNGSYHSARALRDFMNFCKPYDLEITLLISDKDEDHAEHCLREAMKYLSVKGIENAEQVRTNKGIVEAVREDYVDKVDMIVAGVHSKNAFLNFFVGSFVKHLLKEQKVPLFLG